MAELAHQIARRYALVTMKHICNRYFLCLELVPLYNCAAADRCLTIHHILSLRLPRGCMMSLYSNHSEDPGCTQAHCTSAHKHTTTSLSSTLHHLLTNTLHHLLTNKLQHHSPAHCTITHKASSIVSRCQAVPQCRKLCSRCGPGHRPLFCAGQPSTNLFSPWCYA